MFLVRAHAKPTRCPFETPVIGVTLQGHTDPRVQKKRIEEFSNIEHIVYKKSSDLKNREIVDPLQLITNFEKRISFVYAVKSPNEVSRHYLTARQRLKKNCDKKEAIGLLKKAYEEVRSQNNWDFEVSRAADLEYMIILEKSKRHRTEYLEEKIRLLYSAVLGGSEGDFTNAVSIQVFIFQYLRKCPKEGLSDGERSMLLMMARQSKKMLNELAVRKIYQEHDKNFFY